VTDVSTLSRRAVYDWLDALERLTATSDRASLAALARVEMVHLARAWRALLAEHEPAEDNRCRTCARRRRARAERCDVWVSAHRLLIKTDWSSEGGTVWSATMIRPPR
jgi:hypothetical protein